MPLLPPELIERNASRAASLVNHEQITYLANGTSTVSKSVGTIPLTSRFSGQQNPHWIGQLRSFIQAGTPMVAWRDELNTAPVGVSEKLFWDTWTSPTRTSLITLEGNFPTQSMTDASVTSINSASANNLALSDLSSEIYDAHTAFQGSTFIGELKDTLRMLRSPAKTLRERFPDLLNSYGKNVKRGTSRREASRILGDTWLEWQFGVRPLIQDVDNASKLIHEMYRIGSVFNDVTLKGKGKTALTVTADQQSVGASAPFVLGTRLIHHRVSVRYQAGYRLNDNSFANSPYKQAGLSPVDWMPTAWELLPWSFVVDYFTNIGDIITALANTTSSPRWIIKTTHKRVDRETSFNGIQSVAFTPGPYNGKAVDSDVKRGFVRHSRVYVQRELYDGRSLVPSLEFSIPGLGLKWVNLTALYSSLTQKRKSINRKLI